MTYYNTLIASTYGSNNYSQYDYNGSNATTTGAGGSSSAGGSALVNTGVAVAGIVAIAATVLFVAVAIRVWKRKRSTVVANVAE